MSEFGSRNAEVGKEGEKIRNAEVGMRNAEKKRRCEDKECGSRNWLNSEVGMRNAEKKRR